MSVTEECDVFRRVGHRCGAGQSRSCNSSLRERRLDHEHPKSSHSSDSLLYGGGLRGLPQPTTFSLELFLNSAGHGLADYKKLIYAEGRPHFEFRPSPRNSGLLTPPAEQEEIVRRVAI